MLVVALICASDDASAQSLEGRLKQIGESKVVKLAYRSDANPFSFVNPQGQPDGYTVDLCKYVVHSLELQLNTELTIVWVPVDTQSRFDADTIIAAAARYRLPVIYPYRYFITDGGLISYGPDTIEPYSRAAKKHRVTAIDACSTRLENVDWKPKKRMRPDSRAPS